MKKVNAFGSPKNLRQFNLASARVGFNGKENDNDVKGNGNQQDYGERIYDPRLGKFFSVDPLTFDYPWNSTYAFAENRPIDGIDLDGKEFLSGVLDILDRYIPALEKSTATSVKTIVYAAKVVRGMANSTIEGQTRSLVNNVKSTYSQVQAAKRNPQAAQQFIKDNLAETLKSPEQKVGEGLVQMSKGIAKGDPDAIGMAAGTLLQMGAFKVGMPKASSPSGLGDLTVGEANQIQNVVNEAGRPLDVVGSAAKGTRKGVKLNVPLEKGVKSDIDFTASPSSLSYFEGMGTKLPSIDLKGGGIFPGGSNPSIGPGINFSPGGAQIPTSGGKIGGAAVIGVNASNNKDK